MRIPRLTSAIALLLALPVLAACTENADSGGSGDAAADDRTITVTSSDDACEISGAEAAAGTLTFEVTNTGTQVTEFYLLGEDGLRIVGEVENIGPNLSRPLVVSAPAGSYQTACKPGMKGDGIRQDFTVTESDEAVTIDADDPAVVTQAQDNYKAYVEDQSAQLLTKTQTVRRALHRRRRRRGPRPLPRRPRALGADRDRGGVLR